MKILIAEDQPEKRDQIIELLKSSIPISFSFVNKISLRGALKELVGSGSEYDLIILDMSMPNFDPDFSNQSECSPESFAGYELLEQMTMRAIDVPVIVVTQYSYFEGGNVTFEQLSEKFIKDYPKLFLGSVYFNSSMDKWKSDLLDIIRNII